MSHPDRPVSRYAFPPLPRIPHALPVRLFLICLLVWGLGTVAFGWMVKSTLQGSDRSGRLGEIAVTVSGFPTMARGAVRQLTQAATGDIADVNVALPREKAPDAPGFAPLRDLTGLGVKGLHARITGATRPGWRLVSGTVEIAGAPTHAALLLSPRFDIVRAWTLDEAAIDGAEPPRPPHEVFPHGIELLADGSVVYAFDGGRSLQRKDACGHRLWSVPGRFHHAVTLDPAGDSVWTFEREAIAEVGLADGTVRRRITTDAIAAANPDTDILGFRRLDWLDQRDAASNIRHAPYRWLTDPTHFNDVDPLPAALADRFPMFAPGDLLLSARSLNLVFVLDPDTLEIKWWRAGAWRRQHDPDWAETGEILVYDNRMSLDASRIVAIDPATHEVRTVFDGAGTGFFTRIRGKHQQRPDGTLIVTSPQQGHAFETYGDGQMAFEIVNAKPGSETTNYVVSEMRWYGEDALAPDLWACDGLQIARDAPAPVRPAGDAPG